MHVDFPAAELAGMADAAVLALHAGRVKILDIMGVQLLQFTQLDYVTKSNGGTGTDGITWAPIKPETLAARNKGKKNAGKFKGQHQIGVNTGLQRASARPGFTGADGRGGNVQIKADDSIEVGFGRSYSRHFDKRRKLMPEVLPPKWLETLEDIAAKQGGQLIDDALSGPGTT